MALTEFVADRIWLKAYPVRYAGGRFDARMSVVRLPDNGLLLHSPCAIDPATKAHITALGEVRHIVAPGSFHYLHVPSAQRAFPGAQTHICPGIERKRPDIHYDRVLGAQPPAAWRGTIDQVPVLCGRFMREVAMFDRPSRTLLLVDLIENFTDATPHVSWQLKAWMRFVFRMWNRPKPAPEYQFGWKDKAAARQSLETILGWDFERIVLAHGDTITENARERALQAWRVPLGMH